LRALDNTTALERHDDDQDAQGHTLSGATNEAVVLYEQALRAFNVGYGDAAGLFDTARNAAPDFVMAHLGKAWLLTFARDPASRHTPGLC